MKQLLLFLSIFAFCNLNAQFSLTTHDDEAIENDQTFTYNTTSEDVAKLGYIVHNETEATIIMKAEIEEITGSDGTDFEICFGGSCYFQVTQGQIIPQSPVAIPAGGIQGMYDHLWNKNSTSSLITYRIKFYMLDGLQNPTGEPFYINYVYNENLGTQDIQTVTPIKVLNTLVKNTLVIDVTDKASLEIYSSNGQLVLSSTLNNGRNQVSSENLRPGNYFVNIKTDKGNWLTKKIVIK